jgi:LPXTG-motif cell wall-anchored protein
MPFMSLTRRLAAGLPAVGVTVLAALALAGTPAAATGDDAARAKRPAVMTTPCAEGQRGDKCPYAYGTETPTGGPTRGNGGYGSESPTPTASPSTLPATPSTAPTPTPSTPTASVNTVPPGGESPAVSPSPSPSKPGGGVSAGGTLPLTGAPMGLTVALGAALIAAGAGAIYYSRRRRNA